jgi:hypothetical protein
MNQSELSGFITPIAQNIHNTTGVLSGVFYPLNSNPKGYISGADTGFFKTQSDLDTLYYQTIAYVDSRYYLKTNPSGYLSSSPQSQPFSVNCSSGAASEYFAFPITFSGIPRVICSFVNSIDSNSYLLKISGVSTVGFYATYSDNIAKTGYTLDVIADYSPYNPKSYSFEVFCTSGVEKQFVTFPLPFATKPRVICSFLNDVDSSFYGFSISGVNTSGFTVNYSDTIGGSFYKLEVMAEV